MRTMMTGPASGSTAKTILGFFYLYFFLHWGTGILMFKEKLGFSVASVTRYYLGDPELFMMPRSFAGLLEVTHFHLFAMGFFFVVFSHLLLFTPLRDGLKKALTALLAASLLGDIAGGWLIRYAAAEFAWLKLGAFYLLQGVSLAMFVGLTAGLVRPRGSLAP